MVMQTFSQKTKIIMKNQKDPKPIAENSNQFFCSDEIKVQVTAEGVSAIKNFSAGLTKTGSFEELNCIICGEINFEKIADRDRYGMWCPVGVCNVCGNIQSPSYYTQTTLNNFYSSYYRSIYGPSSPEVLFRKTMQSAEKILKILEKFIDKGSKKLKVLDIGCGAGGLLKVFKDNEFEELGVDFDKLYLSYAKSRDLNVKLGSLESLAPNDQFSIIILSHVLEHISNPQAFLKALTPHLSDDGIIYIEVPSVDSIAGGAYSYNLGKYWQNAHCVHYTSKTLAMVCDASDLTPLYFDSNIRSVWGKKKNRTALHFDLKSSSLFTRRLLSDIKRKNLFLFPYFSRAKMRAKLFIKSVCRTIID